MNEEQALAQPSLGVHIPVASLLPVLTSVCLAMPLHGGPDSSEEQQQ